MSRREPSEHSCGQVTSGNFTGSVSLLCIGSLELGPGSLRLPDLMKEIVGTLPEGVDMIACTLTKPLSSGKHISTLEALRYIALKRRVVNMISRCSFFSGVGMRGLGVVSLANELIYSVGQEEAVRMTTHHLQEAGLHWAGLSIREDDVISVNGLRIGVLAYCAVYRECEDSDAPFSPVKYSPRAAATAVKYLQSVSLKVSSFAYK